MSEAAEMPVEKHKGTHRCSCRQYFTSEKDLKKHARQHRKDRPFACRKCAATFKKSFSLKRHQKEVHATEKKFPCSKCDKTFVCQDYLRKHFKSHDRDKKKVPSKGASHASRKRSQSASKRGNGPQHIKLKRSSTKSGEKLKRRSKKKSAARNESTATNAHVKERTSRKRRRSANNSADDSDPQPERAKKKIRLSNDVQNGATDTSSKNGLAPAESPPLPPPVPEEKFSCPKCPKRFNKQTDLERHAWCHIPPVLCDECGEFVSKNVLEKHVAIHAQEKESKETIGVIKYYIRKQSDFCGTSHSDLMAEFKCKLCNEVYDEEADLRRHVKKVHANGALSEVFCCTLCSPVKTYKKEYNYQAHHETVHEKQAGTCYMCAHCDKTFTYKVNLYHHMKDHNPTTNVSDAETP